MFADAYLAFVRISFLNILAYRMRYYTGIITYVLFVSVHYFIWKAVYSGFPRGHLIHGFSLEQMVTYIAVGWICRSLYFSNIDEQIGEYVRTGEIGAYLIRPVNFHVLMLCQAAGETLFRISFFSIPIGVLILLLFPVQLPASLAALVLFVLATLGSFVIFAEINFLVGLLAFRWKSVQGVMRAKYFLVQLLSGLIVPLPFFPQIVQRLLDFTPFPLIAYFPLKLYLGALAPSEIALLFLKFGVWIAVMYIIAEWAWSKAVGRLTIQGG